MDFRPVEEGEERSDSEGSHNEESKDHEKTTKKEGEKTDRVVAGKGDFSCIWSVLLCGSSITQLPRTMQCYRSSGRSSPNFFTSCQVRYPTEIPASRPTADKPF